MTSGLSPHVGDAECRDASSSNASSSDASSCRRGHRTGSVGRASLPVADGGSGRDSSHPASVTRSSSVDACVRRSSRRRHGDVETRYGLDASPDDEHRVHGNVQHRFDGYHGVHVVSSAASARIRTTRAAAASVPPIASDHTARARAQVTTRNARRSSKGLVVHSQSWHRVVSETRCHLAELQRRSRFTSRPRRFPPPSPPPPPRPWASPRAGPGTCPPRCSSRPPW